MGDLFTRTHVRFSWIRSTQLCVFHFLSPLVFGREGKQPANTYSSSWLPDDLVWSLDRRLGCSSTDPRSAKTAALLVLVIQLAVYLRRKISSLSIGSLHACACMEGFHNIILAPKTLGHISLASFPLIPRDYSFGSLKRLNSNGERRRKRVKNTGQKKSLTRNQDPLFKQAFQQLSESWSAA